MNIEVVYIWIIGLSIMFGLYYLSNPFGVYDDIVIIGGLVIYTLNKIRSVLK